MRYFALDVALESTASTVLTYTCGVAYGLLTLALLVRYVHNLTSRNFGVLKLSMLLLMGYIVYSGTRSMTLLYSAVVGRISNTMLILPTAWYLLLMGFMARLWSMYLHLLAKEKRSRSVTTITMIANNSSFAAPASPGVVGGAHHYFAPSHRAAAQHHEDANSYLLPAPASVVTMPCSSPATTASDMTTTTTSTSITTSSHEESAPQATPPPAAVPRTLATSGGASGGAQTPSPLLLTASALQQQQQQQHAAPSSPTAAPPLTQSCSCISEHPLSSAVIGVSAVSATIIFTLGIMCSNMRSLEHSHCVDIPSIADVAACWACGGLMVVLAYRLYKCGADATAGHTAASSSPYQTRLPPRSSRPPPLIHLPAASLSYSVPWVNSGASLSVASSSEADLDHHGNGNSINAEDPHQQPFLGAHAAADQNAPPSHGDSTCRCCAGVSVCCGAATAASRCFAMWTSHQSLHARTVAAAFLFGGYTITRGCTVASNIFAAEKSNLTHHDEEYLTPAFYIVEWICLVLCARLIVGPPRTSSSSLS